MDSIVKPTLVLTAGRALAFAGTFLIPVILVRVFDQSEFGTYKQVLLIFTTLYHLPQLGMAEGLFYFLPKDPGRTGRYVANSILFLGGAGLAVFLVLSVAADLIARWMGNESLAGLMGLTGMFTGLSLAAALLEMVMISRKEYLTASLTYAVSDLVRAALLVVPALLTRDLRWVVAGAAAFAGARVLAMLWYARRHLADGLRPDAGAFRHQLSYSLPLGVASIVAILQGTFHQYAVSWSFGAAAFAIYSVGCLQIPLIEFVAGPAGNVMMVRMTEEIREGREGNVLTLWLETTRRLALLFVPLVVLLVVVARPLIVLLFTADYLASVPVFVVWSLVMLSTVLITDGVLRVYADTRFLLVLNSLRLVLNVALMGVFLRAFGVVGAVGVTVLAILAAKAAALVRMGRLMRVGPGRILPWGALSAIGTASAVAAVPTALTVWWLPAGDLALIAAGGLVFAASYTWLASRLGVLTPAERHALAGWLRDRARVLRPAGAAAPRGQRPFEAAPERRELLPGSAVRR